MTGNLQRRLRVRGVDGDREHMYIFALGFDLVFDVKIGIVHKTFYSDSHGLIAIRWSLYKLGKTVCKSAKSGWSLR